MTSGAYFTKALRLVLQLILMVESYRNQLRNDLNCETGPCRYDLFDRITFSHLNHISLLFTGRAGAHFLWSTLRDKSSNKLKRADALIPQELTDAYGAFVRECLTNNKTVAARSFYSEEGVGFIFHTNVVNIPRK